MVDISRREEVIQVVNKLFIYTDSFQWDKLINEVFAEAVVFDMSSLGAGPAAKKTSQEICSMWQAGFAGIDAVHHHAGNYLVSFPEEGQATAFCYATATHYKKAATKGNVRTFVGSYEILLVLTDVGWKINGFKYIVKYIDGNSTLE